MEGLKEFLTYITNQFKFWFIIKEWDHGLHLRNGKIIRVLNHGLFFRFPFLDTVYSKSKRLQDITISQVNFTTKDQKHITASVTAHFKIDNIEEYYNGFAEPFSVIDVIIKNETAKYFLSVEYQDFEVREYESRILNVLRSIQSKGFLFEDVKLVTFSNARTYRLITDKLYSQKDAELEVELH